MDHISDPSLKMRRIKVIFADSQYDYSTNINGTRAEIAEYFQQGPLNVASISEDGDNMQMPVKIYFLDQDIMLTLRRT
jgi:hypothetical protein